MMNKLVHTLLALVVVAAVAALPGRANATVFSFGTIDATDEITSIQLSADDGSGSPTVDFDTSTNTLVISASVSTINFANKAAISGIAAGDVVFSSTVDLTGAYSFGGPVNPTFTAGSFTNGVAADFSITDIAGGNMVLSADYVGSLDLTILAAGFVIRGEFSGEFDLIDIGTGTDADVAAAWGSSGTYDQLFTIGTGANLCWQVTNCPVATDWVDWSANTTSTLLPVAVVPEPQGLLLMLSAGGLAALIRRRVQG